MLEPWVCSVKWVDFDMGISHLIFGFRPSSSSSVFLLAISYSLASYRSKQGKWKKILFLDSKHTVAYLTASKITEVIRKATKMFYPDISKENLMKHSTYSTRVWVCVSLGEAGMSPDFINKRLRWMGESYRVYLRDANKINEQHNVALK